MSNIKLFLSWAHADHALKEDLVSRLRPRLKIAKRYNFTWWEDSLLHPGEEWGKGIDSRFEEGDYIVQLVSPSFLASDFIRNHEIPGLGKTPNKKTLPLMLKDVPLNGDYEFHNINGWQIFRRPDQRAYGDLRGNAQKDRFVNEFTDTIIRRVDNRGGYR